MPLEASELRRGTDPAAFPFATTAELGPPEGLPGQERAEAALGLAAEARGGFHAFVAGPPRLGKHKAVLRLLETRARSGETPPDWCYVQNFAAPERPTALQLPSGRGPALQGDLEHFIQQLTDLIPAAFESDEYRARVRALEKDAEKAREELFLTFKREAEAKDVTFARTPTGMILAPLKGGKALSPEEFHALDKPEHDRLRAELEGQEERLQELIEKLPTLAREHEERVQELGRTIGQGILRRLMEALRQRYVDLPAVVAYLGRVEEDVLRNMQLFMEAHQHVQELPEALRRVLGPPPPPLERYRVNVLVARGPGSGRPVVFDDWPTFARLVGRIEHRQQLGALTTDFTMIRKGALHEANGGFLVLDAFRLLTQPYAWEELKRSLRAGYVRTSSLGEMLGLFSSAPLEPEPIPLDVRVVLLGDRRIYYLLGELDPEFLALFKIVADFEDQMDRTPGSELEFVRAAAAIARAEHLLPMDREASALLAEFGARLCGDRDKLSLRADPVADVVREADHWARREGVGAIRRADVDRALSERIHRADRVRARIQESIRRGTLLIDTSGSVPGQVHGLTVVQLADFSFGWPVRVTSRARFGRGQVLDIERESELGGAIHSKGVMILVGYLSGRYAAQGPLSLSATLVFEQSYAPVEGDSASAAELFALLTALAEVPVRQSLAVTGSLNQRGVVQPVGAVNEKIEGFFDVCRDRGLTGDEGVVIPRANVKNLMLRRDVVEAAAAGRFHVYAIGTVDEGLELLTGTPAAAVNDRVEARLSAFAEQARALAHGAFR